MKQLKESLSRTKAERLEAYAEQKLAYLLAQLVEQKKETLALMEVVNIAAKECVEWKKTDEGKAWDEEMKVKREKKRESSG